MNEPTDDLLHIIRDRVQQIRADYPSDVFPGDTGKGARMAIDRVLLLFALEEPLLAPESEAARLRADNAALESQLGAAHERIAVLEAALRQAAGMKSIKGARVIAADTLQERRE